MIIKKYNILIIVPELARDKFPGSRGYNLGNMLDPNARYLRTTDEAMEQGGTDLKEVTTFLTEPKKFQNQWVLT